ncbi:MAG: hypothetical protein IKT40_13070 [Bacilli bacterium]|jgi:hypothetical protein|nr:hypothetical protein [Bacilli bacterium]
MELFNEITAYIKRTKLDNAIFKLLLLYNTNLQDSLCYDLIQEVTKKIENNIVIYNKEKSVELYNIIDNDFATLKALYEEYKREVYPLFPLRALALLSVLPKTDVEKMNVFLNKYLIDEQTDHLQQLLFQIYKTLMYFPSEQYRTSVKEFLNATTISEDRLESVMASIKQHKKDLKSEGLEASYIELLAMYFNYLCMVRKDV